MIEIRDVNKNDIDFLYELILVRDKREFMNSDMPTKKQHIQFINKFLNNPNEHHYENCKIILLESKKIGCLILMKRNHELGFYLLPEYVGKGFGTSAMKMLMKEANKPYYTALIHSYNEHSKRYFEKLGGKSIGSWYMIK